MHRTVSLNYGVVIHGSIELILDSGETRLMKPGDICVQRDTMHVWRNASETEWARILYVLQPSKPVVVVGDKALEEDYGTMSGVPPSA
jgi:quercetin dioxygenase-like cupin family protein